jgi:hypothetical protein
MLNVGAKEAKITGGSELAVSLLLPAYSSGLQRAYDQNVNALVVNADVFFQHMLVKHRRHHFAFALPYFAARGE